MPRQDWAALQRQGNERLAFFEQLDGFYVFTQRNPAVATRALHRRFGARLRADPAFMGYCVIGAPPAGPARVNPGWPESEQQFSLLDVLRTQSAAPGRIGVATLNGTLEEEALLRPLQGLCVDYLVWLAARDEAHTCVSLFQEREYVLAYLARFLALAETLDAASRRVLRARVSAYLALDRHALLRSITPAVHRYFNPVNPDDSFIPRQREVYADVGARRGQDVLKLAGLVGELERSRLWALEPDALDFGVLKQLPFFLPLEAYRMAASDRDSETIGFFSDPLNPAGSHFVAPDDEAAWSGERASHIDRVEQVRLDTLIDTPLTLLKVDTGGGGEMAVLRGAQRHVARPQCRVCISADRYPQDVFELCDFFAALGGRRLRLRQHDGSLRGLVLYADGGGEA